MRECGTRRGRTVNEAEAQAQAAAENKRVVRKRDEKEKERERGKRGEVGKWWGWRDGGGERVEEASGRTQRRWRGGAVRGDSQVDLRRARIKTGQQRCCSLRQLLPNVV